MRTALPSTAESPLYASSIWEVTPDTDGAFVFVCVQEVRKIRNNNAFRLISNPINFTRDEMYFRIREVILTCF